MSSNGNCASCGRAIDVAAKTCPYCGADPQTGEKAVDTQAILQEVFHPREISTSESVMEFARQRQGVVLVGTLIVAFLILAGIHQLMTVRNANAVTDAPAVPLSEITDMANQPKAATTSAPMPELDFPFDGHPQTMRTFIVERGAVAPAAALAPPPPAATGTAAPVQLPSVSTLPARPAPQPQRP
ncbi:MAG TPA: zinc ribbon domain-containing protein [Thermoanaerobaculia bacterium]|nr:zinc ribbon domain-containing protein [Thermoanaerobaculia bacterium]